MIATGSGRLVARPSLSGGTMNTRTIAIAALAVAVILVIVLFVV
jgi:hypothetical protein